MHDGHDCYEEQLIILFFFLFQQYGQVDRVDYDDVDNSAIISFKTRLDVENVSLHL